MALLDLFKTLTWWRTASAPAPTARALPVTKPSAEKLSKTVLPNATRTVRPDDPFEAAAGQNRGNGLPQRPSQTSGLPPAVAIALEPKIERTLSLPLTDLVGHIPDGYLKPSEARDPDRRVLLKAAEVERGMAAGKPMVSLTSLYEQAPELFLKTVPEDETLQVPLPFEKVLAEFAKARVRPDQEREKAVPQVDTPILHATIEDSEKFGIDFGPCETSAMPPVRLEPASARAIAEAEPEVAVREPVTPPPPPPPRPAVKISAPLPAAPTPPAAPKSPSAAAAPSTPAAAEPPRVTPPRRPKVYLDLPPNGTGEPASERVPASSGLPVPTSARPTVKMPAPSDELKPRKTLLPGTGDKAKETVSDPNAPKISLPLRSILQNVPPIQLNGSPSEVPAELRIEFPLSLVQPQLVSGRVAIPVNVFREAMPPQHRDMIVLDLGETPVMLPLQDVLANLPSSALQMREDQEEVEKGDHFETPFSIKAKEDAARFKTSDEPVAKPAISSAEPKVEPAATAVVSAVSADSQVEATEPAKLETKAAVVSAVSANPKESASAATAPKTFASGPGAAAAAPVQATVARTADSPSAPATKADVPAATAPKPKIQMPTEPAKAEAKTEAVTKAEASAATPAKTSGGDTVCGVPPTNPLDNAVAAVLDAVVTAAEAAAAKPAPRAPDATVSKVEPKPANVDTKTVAEATAQKFDAKEVVARAMTLPNVTGCSVTFVDGLILAGNLPDEVAVEGLCAMAPSLLQRIEKHMADTNLGALNSLTLHCQKSCVTFFSEGNICLAALHGAEGLGRETETKLAAMTTELSRTYAQPGA